MKRKPTRRQPAHDLPAIQRRMITMLNDGKQSLERRAQIGLSLLADQAAAPAAETALRKICSAPGMNPKLFTRIGRALTNHEARMPEKVKRVRDASAVSAAELIAGPWRWAVYFAGLDDQWWVAHPETHDQDFVTHKLGLSRAAIKDWDRTGPRITAALRAAGVPQSFNNTAWLKANPGAHDELRAVLAEFIPPRTDFNA